MAVDPRKFLLNTDYEMDKIIYFTSGEINAMDNKNIPHGLGFAPLVFGVCAFNSNFSDARSMPFSEITRDNTIAFTLDADSTNVKIGYGNYADNPPKMYYRVYAFEPSNSSAVIAPTNDKANTFVLNTDYNYCKLFQKGTVSGTGSHTINHGLGYVPQVLAWRQTNSGLISPIEESVPYDPYSNMPNYIAVTNSSVLFNLPTNYSNISTVHYRIYYDEA